MQHQKDPTQAALAAIREIRQRIEGFIPFEQAGYIAELFDEAVASVKSISPSREESLAATRGDTTGEVK